MENIVFCFVRTDFSCNASVFVFLATLRALYLGDNDFEYLPADIENFSSLQVLVLRENDLLALPKEIGKLYRLRELHIQVFTIYIEPILPYE